MSPGVYANASRKGNGDLHMQWGPEVLSRNRKALQGPYKAPEQVET